MDKPNKLINEKSPYLLQHAYNPVLWYAWGKEAFETAKRENKPVLLSIGYSTCHWCHVMAHESFENEQIAEVINKYFIPIKVDREERPDIDHIYMTSVSAMTGQGGWPLTVFLTFNQKPFYGGTYFPPYAKWGSPGFIDVLMSVQQAWANDSERIQRSSEQLTALVGAHLPQGGKQSVLAQDIMEKSYGEFAQSYDSTYGGFGSSPKFPTSHNFSFLLRYAKRFNNDHAANMVMHSLTQMAKGGIYDHLGGGFHRYSVDGQWQIPHFEKMLYDQAIIIRTLLEAYQFSHEPFFESVIRQSLDYVTRELQSPAGGFYSAQDADSYDPEVDENREGTFFLWKEDEIVKVLGKETAEIFNYRYGIMANGNAISDPHGEFINKNIIWSAHTLFDTAQKFKQSTDAIERLLNEAKQKLFLIREKRQPPHLDDKVLVDWNGLMIGTFAFASRVLREKSFLESAQKAANFILSKMVINNRLYHRYREGDVAILGNVDDYAFIISGLLDLYEASGKVDYLFSANSLAKAMIELFYDNDQGGFYFSAQDDEELILRPKQVYDGAIPSGNSIAVLALMKLYHFTLNEEFKEKALCTINSFSKQIEQRPSAYSQMLISYDFIQGPVKEIVVAANNEKEMQEICDELCYDFVPHQVVIAQPKDEIFKNRLQSIAPFTKSKESINGQLTVYVCQNQQCNLPVHRKEDIKGLLI